MSTRGRDLIKAGTIKAFCNSVTVLPSPVDENETASGIIVPLDYEGNAKIERGVIISKGECHCEMWDRLRPGLVIFYKKGTQIRDVVVVFHDDIVAYEEEDE